MSLHLFHLNLCTFKLSCSRQGREEVDSRHLSTFAGNHSGCCTLGGIQFSRGGKKDHRYYFNGVSSPVPCSKSHLQCPA